MKLICLEIRFEKGKAQRLAAWRRAVLIAESQEAICRKRLEELECQLRNEGERMKEALEELGDLERVRFGRPIVFTFFIFQAKFPFIAASDAFVLSA